MVFDIIDKGKTFALLVREDKEYVLDAKTQRRKNSVELTEVQLRDLLGSWLAKRLQPW